jgi:hypothetical protein
MAKAKAKAEPSAKDKKKAVKAEKAEKPEKKAPAKKAAPKAEPARPRGRALRKGERPWPARIVDEEFGGKDKLVEAVRKLISDELLEDRLSEDKGLERVSNKKLLRLHAIGTRVQSEFGGRAGLIDAILAAEKRTKDEGYKARLTRYPTPRLLDIVTAARRRQKNAA